MTREPGEEREGSHQSIRHGARLCSVEPSDRARSNTGDLKYRSHINKRKSFFTLRVAELPERCGVPLPGHIPNTPGRVPASPAPVTLPRSGGSGIGGGLALPGEGAAGREQRSAVDWQRLARAASAMADEELEALRQRRLGEIRAEHGVRGRARREGTGGSGPSTG